MTTFEAVELVRTWPADDELMKCFPISLDNELGAVVTCDGKPVESRLLPPTLVAIAEHSGLLEECTTDDDLRGAIMAGIDKARPLDEHWAGLVQRAKEIELERLQTTYREESFRWN